jgi:phosphoribosyl 1,2-cyclic phosphodiesterase
MKLTVLGSSSSGNCYILENDTEILIIELGIKFQIVKKAIRFNVSKVVYALCSHEHGDHSCAVKEALAAGINVVMSKGTQVALNIKSHRIINIGHAQKYKAGNFEVMAFDIKHDCKEPLGFLIRHPETGTIVFITDSYFVEYTFPGINNIMIEANYSDEIINDNMINGKLINFVRDRTINSHMSIDTCKDFLKANDLSAVNNIVLIHLSANNGDANSFKKQVHTLTRKNVNVASKGLCINFNQTPF